MEGLLQNLKFLNSIKYSAFLILSPYKWNALNYSDDF